VNFQDIILKFDQYWAKQGCAIIQPYDLEKGAGTFNPPPFRFAHARENRVAYAEPCRRPGDGRFGENPNRLGKYYQYQVVIKPPSRDIQQIYLSSLKAVGINADEHDIRWIEDDWNLRPWEPPAWAGKSGWTGWR